MAIDGQGTPTDPRGDRPEFATPPSGPTRSPLFVALLSVVVIAAAVAVVLTRGTENAEAVTYRHAFTDGQTRTYDLSMTMDMEPVDVPGQEPITGRMTGTMTMSVVEVNDDGSAVVDMTVSNIQVQGVSPDQAPFEGKREQTVRMTIAPDGRVVSVESGSLDFLPIGAPGLAGETSPTGGSSSQFFVPQFPNGGIVPGDTWTETREVPLMDEETKAQFEQEDVPVPLPTDGSMEVTVEGRHDGFEETDYGRAARIHQDIHMPMDFEFPLGAFFAAFIEGFGGTSGRPGQPAPTVPPELMEAVMVMQGNMDMAADTLVRAADGDLVRMDGEMDTDMRIEMRNLPDELSQGAPSEFAMRGTMTMHVIRTG